MKKKEGKNNQERKMPGDGILRVGTGFPSKWRRMRGSGSSPCCPERVRGGAVGRGGGGGRVFCRKVQSL